MGKIIAIANHKGGVGKTVSTANIGAGLRLLGKQCLLIDLDPQASLTKSLGIEGPAKTIYGVLRGSYKPEPVQIRPGLELIPSDLDLSGAEVELINETGREYVLREILEPLKGGYDFILIDTPPSLGILTVNALTAAQEVLIPLQAQFLALHGLSKLLEVIGKIQKRLNPGLQVGGVFLTQFNARKVLNRNVLEAVQARFKDGLFSTHIRDNVALSEAPYAGVDIFTYSPKCYGAEDYLSLCKEILRRAGK
jgi:chromosome partitioning protein